MEIPVEENWHTGHFPEMEKISSVNCRKGPGLMEKFWGFKNFEEYLEYIKKNGGEFMTCDSRLEPSDDPKLTFVTDKGCLKIKGPNGILYRIFLELDGVESEKYIDRLELRGWGYLNLAAVVQQIQNMNLGIKINLMGKQLKS